MQVDAKTVKQIARLSQIQITDQESQELQGELSDIFDWIEQLNEVDTEAVEPMDCPIPIQLKRRVDQVRDGQIVSSVVANAPESRDGYFVVQKVVE